MRLAGQQYGDLVQGLHFEPGAFGQVPEAQEAGGIRLGGDTVFAQPMYAGERGGFLISAFCFLLCLWVGGGFAAAAAQGKDERGQEP